MGSFCFSLYFYFVSSYFLCVVFCLRTHFTRILKNGSSHALLVKSYLVLGSSWPGVQLVRAQRENSKPGLLLVKIIY